MWYAYKKKIAWSGADNAKNAKQWAWESFNEGVCELGTTNIKDIRFIKNTIKAHFGNIKIQRWCLKWIELKIMLSKKQK